MYSFVCISSWNYSLLNTRTILNVRFIVWLKKQSLSTDRNIWGDEWGYEVQSRYYIVII